jgi:hypothetical protein
MNTSYDTKAKTVTVNGVTYDVDSESSRDGMTDLLTIEEFPGLEARIGYEDHIEEWMNPRHDVDGILGVMMTSHRNYNLGGCDHDIELGRDEDLTVPCDHCERTGYVPWEEYDGGPAMPDTDGEMSCRECEGEGERRVGPVEWAQTVHKARVVLPLYLYDHGGISMRAGTFGSAPGYPYNCEWDAGMVGIVFDTAETRAECGWEERSDEEIEADLRSEINVYDEYLQGNIRWYRVEDDETGYDDGCGGMLGDDGYVDDETYASLTRAVVDRLAELAERGEWASRDVVTL